MKNLFFALAFMLIGTFSFASNNAKEEIVVAVAEQNIELSNVVMGIAGDRCYLLTTDDYGNVYYKRIPCPEQQQ
tara:strand:+ start:247 stop:468 length:222 start_codon:yes stop_codon:yes gene_type:complete